MWPDLVLEEFTVDWSEGQLQSLYFIVPFHVIIHNKGKLQVAQPFHVTLQYSASANPTFHGENDGNNCFQVTTLLEPNQTYLLSDKLKVMTSNLSDQTIKFRALVDFECFTDIPAPNGQIAESHEDNNLSNEVSYTSGYLPNLTHIEPNICTKDVDDCQLLGQSLSANQGNYTIVVEQGGHKTAVAVKSWASSVIHFTVPAEVKVGWNQIYIAEIGTLKRISNMLAFTVAEVTPIPWVKMLAPFDLLGLASSLRLHTWDGTSEPNDQSLLIFPPTSATSPPDSIRIDVPKIEFTNWAGHYRFMLYDMGSDNRGLVFNRTNCAPNQFRLNLAFEDIDKEIIGYYKVLGPAGQWRRTGAPDIQIDNANLGYSIFSLQRQRNP